MKFLRLKYGFESIDLQGQFLLTKRKMHQSSLKFIVTRQDQWRL